MENNIITLILISLISHVIFDFTFQNEVIIAGRFPQSRLNINSLKSVAIANSIHSTLHVMGIVISIIVVGFFAGFDLSASIIQILAIGVSHFLIDYGKSILVMIDNKNNNIWLFTADQMLHLISIILIFTICNTNNFFSEFYDMAIKYPSSLLPHDKILFGILILLVCSFASGYMAKMLLGRVHSEVNHEEDGGALNGGFIIGILERLFIIIGIVIKQPSIIVLVLTLKSIARYNKFKDDDFVEYFIIGTLFSLIVGIIGGVLIAKMISFSIS